MEELFNDMVNKGLISIDYSNKFINTCFISPDQITSWKFLDNKIAIVTKMRLQHAILPCQLNRYSKN